MLTKDVSHPGEGKSGCRIVADVTISFCEPKFLISLKEKNDNMLLEH